MKIHPNRLTSLFSRFKDNDNLTKHWEVDNLWNTKMVNITDKQVSLLHYWLDDKEYFKINEFLIKYEVKSIKY